MLAERELKRGGADEWRSASSNAAITAPRSTRVASPSRRSTITSRTGEAMLAACVQHGLIWWKRAAGRNRQRRDGHGPPRRLSHAARRSARPISAAAPARISDAELSGGEPQARAADQDQDRPQDCDLISAGITDGSIAPSDPKITAFALAGHSISSAARTSATPRPDGPKMDQRTVHRTAGERHRAR